MTVSRPSPTAIVAALGLALVASPAAAEIRAVLHELPAPDFAVTAGVSNIAADGTVVGTGWPDSMVVRWQPGQAPENLGGGNTYTLENIMPLLSADGSTIVANIYYPNPDVEFGELPQTAIWQGGTTWQPIGDTVLAQGTPFGISDDGAWIVGSGLATTTPGPDDLEQPWIWSAADGQTVLGLLDGATQQQPWAVAVGGTVAVGYGVGESTNWARRAVRWDDGVPTLIIDAESNPVGQAIGCNSDCSVIVGAGVTDPGTSSPQAWRWTEAGGVQYLGTLPGVADDVTYYAFDTTEDGTMIVGSYPIPAPDGSLMNRGLLWTEATGLVDMAAFLASHGVDYGDDFGDLVVNSITRDGTRMLLNGATMDYARRRAVVTLVDVVFDDGFEAAVEE